VAGAAAPLLCGACYEVRATCIQSIRYTCNDLAQSSSYTTTYLLLGRAIPHSHAAIGRRRVRTQGSALAQVTGGVSGSGGAARVRSATGIRSSHLLALRLHSAFDIDGCCHLSRTFSPPNTRSPRQSRFQDGLQSQQSAALVHEE
jgi:hypothetical protein